MKLYIHTPNSFVEDALDGAKFFGSGSFEEGGVVEMSQTGSFSFADLSVGRKRMYFL